MLILIIFVRQSYKMETRKSRSITSQMILTYTHWIRIKLTADCLLRQRLGDLMGLCAEPRSIAQWVARPVACGTM
jgi:hypothetical protein